MTVIDILDKIKPWVIVKIVDMDYPSHSLNQAVISLFDVRRELSTVRVEYLNIESDKLIIGISHFDFETLKD